MAITFGQENRLDAGLVILVIERYLLGRMKRVADESETDSDREGSKRDAHR
jgi:hypothetical protein